MTDKQTYGPVKTCIYCGATRYNADREKLGNEHVIPEALNGRMILTEASCQDCERAINRFEMPCNKKLFGPVRYWMKLATKKPRERPEKLPVILRYNSILKERIVKIPTAKYPVSIAILLPDYPGITGKTNPNAGSTIISLLPATPEKFAERRRQIAKEYKASECVVEGAILFSEYQKLIAKIAYSYATSLLGTTAFKPLLCDYILGKNEEDGKRYVGVTGEDFQESESLHEIWFSTWTMGNERLLVVHVRLFALWLRTDFVAVTGILNPRINVSSDVFKVPSPGLP